MNASLLWAHLVPRRFAIALWALCLLLAGCPFSSAPEDGTGDGGATKREKDVSGRLAVALGGSAEGADEILFEEALTSLELENNDPDLFDVEPRPGTEGLADGKGARIVPKKTGIGYVTPTINGHPREPVEVTIPPQSLIQILLGEARGELRREATTEADDPARVKASSVSITGDAVAAVIRNRIRLIQLEDAPSLFVVDAVDFGRDPPQSFYDAVIEANDGRVFQFSPVDPDDPSFPIFQAAAERESLASNDAGSLVAYDQAVWTAAGIFTEDTDDPTDGAFAFYSPTASQFEAIQAGLDSGSTSLPAGCGASDGNFPALAPVQVLVLDGIAPSLINNGGLRVPSFVFVRSRNSFEPAVTDSPEP